MRRSEGALLEERFWLHVAMIPEHSCYEWIGDRHRNGYGRQKIGGFMRDAHRLSWEIHNGPIPEGMHILHACDRPSCVRIEHLFLGTQADNMKDMNVKGRGNYVGNLPPAGERHPRAKLTIEKVHEIRRRVAAGETRNAVAQDLGLTKSHVGHVIGGRVWAHVPMEVHS